MSITPVGGIGLGRAASASCSEKRRPYAARALRHLVPSIRRLTATGGPAGESSGRQRPHPSAEVIAANLCALTLWRHRRQKASSWETIISVVSLACTTRRTGGVSPRRVVLAIMQRQPGHRACLCTGESLRRCNRRKMAWADISSISASHGGDITQEAPKRINLKISPHALRQNRGESINRRHNLARRRAAATAAMAA